jgi:imidazolonepropionase
MKGKRAGGLINVLSMKNKLLIGLTFLRCRMSSETTRQSVDLLITGASQIIPVAYQGPVTGTEFSSELEIQQGDIAVREGIIAEIGQNLSEKYHARQILYVPGMVVMPGFVDSHTHLVFAGSRAHELDDKVAGIAAARVQEGLRGIHYTVAQTRAASEDVLVEKALQDLDTMLLYGTTTVEAKTGYGLSIDAEEKLAWVLERVSAQHPMTVIQTFLGGHTVPLEYTDDRTGYALLVKRMIPQLCGNMEFCDVFCDPKGFTPEWADEILGAAYEFGLGLRMHIDQTANIRGGELAARLQVKSVSHVDYTSDAALENLARNGVFVELLPGVTFHQTEATPGGLTEKLFWPERVRHMVDLGLPLVLATDYNPGTCVTRSMPMVMVLASRLYRMSPSQIIKASTTNAARSLNIGDHVGSLEVGKDADIIVVKGPTYRELVNEFGTNPVVHVVKKGRVVVENQRLVNTLR